MLNTKAKVPAISAFAVLSLVIFALSTLFACSVMTKWHGIIVGAMFMIAAIPIHCIGKRANWGYIVSFLLNSIANGFSMSAVYIKNEYEPKMSSMLTAIIPSALILLAVCVFLQFFRKSKKVTVTLACIIDIVFTLVFMVQWITKDSDVISSFAFFSLLITLFYLCVFGFAVNHDRRNTLRFVSFGSFSAFMVLSLVVALIVSEGEFLENLDSLVDVNTGSRKKKRMNKDNV